MFPALLPSFTTWTNLEALTLLGPVKLYSPPPPIILREKNWMDLGSIVLSEISQSEKDKYHMISLMWNLIEKLN